MTDPLYKIVYKKIKNDIKNGVYEVDSKLPNDDELAKTFKVSRVTISKAMNLLKQEQIVSRTPKVGTFILANQPDGPKKNKVKIGILLTGFNDLFGSEFLTSFILLGQLNYQILLRLSNSQIGIEEKLISDLLDEGVDGLIILPTSSSTINPTLLKLIAEKFPLIVLDRSLTDLPTCSVMSDNKFDAVNLTNILIKNGHKNIAMISKRGNISSVSEREKGFINAHMKSDLMLRQNNILFLENDNLDETVEIIKQFLIDNPDITGIFAEEYFIGYCVEKAANQLSLAIPEKLSLVCFDSPTSFYKNSELSITHIRQNEALMAEKCLTLFENLFENRAFYEKVTVPGDLIIGNSVKLMTE